MLHAVQDCDAQNCSTALRQLLSNPGTPAVSAVKNVIDQLWHLAAAPSMVSSESTLQPGLSDIAALAMHAAYPPAAGCPAAQHEPRTAYEARCTHSACAAGSQQQPSGCPALPSNSWPRLAQAARNMHLLSK
jgi:hypothetical protein